MQTSLWICGSIGLAALVFVFGFMMYADWKRRRILTPVI